MSGTTIDRFAFTALLLTLIPNCYVQLYSITDLRTLPGATESEACTHFCRSRVGSVSKTTSPVPSSQNLRTPLGQTPPGDATTCASG